MKANRKKRAIANVSFSTTIKIVTFAIGILLPRLIIGQYGSETNGLLQTVANIYSYLALIMAGVSNASAQGLYKTLASGDREAISSVLVTTKKYYTKMIMYYAVGVAIFTAVFPFVVDSTIDTFTICAIIFLEGLSFILTYYFTSTVQGLLIVDGREYITHIVQFVVFILTSAVKIVLIFLGVNIIYLQLSYLAVNVLQIVIYQIYFKKKYPWVNWRAKPDFSILKNRKHYLLNGVSWTVFNSTDTIIISVVCGLVYSSIYAMYNLIYANLNLILAILYSSIYFILGQVYNEDKERYRTLHDGFESVITGVVFGFLSVAYLLTLPFMKLYTSGISDVNYVDRYLPILFCLVQMLSNTRLVSGNLINISNNPKMTNVASIIEVMINISLSITLAYFIGLHGVLIATVVALAFKTNFIIVVSNKKILNRKPLRTYLTVGTNFLLFGLIVLFEYFVNYEIVNVGYFILAGVVLTVVIVPLFFVINMAINPKAYNAFKQIIRKNKKQTNE